MSKIVHGDSREELGHLADGSIDLLCTDPPYGIAFMGRAWDKALPGVELWREMIGATRRGQRCLTPVG